jgi:thymidylate synthase (FAD)
MKILDYGYLELVESWGSDERIIEAARMSTGKGFLGWGPKGWECHHTGCGWKTGDVDHPGRCPQCNDGLYSILGDEKLLRYLWANKHHTPFEMAGLTIEVQAPIFVFREWHRHRVPFSYNEMSARYAPLPDLNYMPTLERFALTGGPSKQSQSLGGRIFDPKTAHLAQQAIDRVYKLAQTEYEAMLESGVSKELARIVLPVGRYSRMRASANLRGWLNFLTLRMPAAAQYEIRAYAEALSETIATLFPRTHALFLEGFGK